MIHKTGFLIFIFTEEHNLYDDHNARPMKTRFFCKLSCMLVFYSGFSQPKNQLPFSPAASIKARVEENVPSHNAWMKAITWPDAPAFVRENLKWGDDTIPGFHPEKFTYQIEIPYICQKVPALLAYPQDLNARIKVDRAKNLNGTVADRTYTFTVTAEDDTTIHVYQVTLKRDMPLALSQPLRVAPMLTEYHFRINGNTYFEVSNPGNRPLDLSQYVFFAGWDQTGTTPCEIWGALLEPEDYQHRHSYYIPGYKPVSRDQWEATPGYYEKDYSVNPVLEPGETFLMCFSAVGKPTRPAPLDVMKRTDYLWLKEGEWTREQYENFITNREAHGTNNCKIEWQEGQLFLEPWHKNRPLIIAKILNDSILEGTKGRGDIQDIRIVEVFGNYKGHVWNPAGEEVKSGGWCLQRKSQFWKPNPLPGIEGSFDTVPGSSEWVYYDTTARPEKIFTEDLGVHTFDTVTAYKSTVSSFTLKISEGYKRGQSIHGVLSSTKVHELFDLLIKADEGQKLKVVGKDSSDTLSQDDTLRVISADSSNITTYGIHTGPLDDQAVLTSSKYDISIDGDQGTIAGIAFGTSVRQVLNNVKKPEQAIVNVIDEHDAPVPLQQRNYDSLYVKTQATGYIHFEVVAENGQDIITYRLQTDLEADEAYAVSNFLKVYQPMQLVGYLPEGLNTETLFTLLKPNYGGDIKLVDLEGNEVKPDRISPESMVQVVVTSPDGSTQKVYDLYNKKYDIPWVVTWYWILKIDQGKKMIWNIEQKDSVQNFKQSLFAKPEGSSMSVLDADSNLVTSGPIENHHPAQGSR